MNAGMSAKYISTLDSSSLTVSRQISSLALLYRARSWDLENWLSNLIKIMQQEQVSIWTAASKAEKWEVKQSHWLWRGTNLLAL